jgi:hypothetical protein
LARADLKRNNSLILDIYLGPVDVVTNAWAHPKSVLEYPGRIAPLAEALTSERVQLIFRYHVAQVRRWHEELDLLRVAKEFNGGLLRHATETHRMETRHMIRFPHVCKVVPSDRFPKELALVKDEENILPSRWVC